MVATTNGQCVIKETLEGNKNDPQALGHKVANKLRALGAAEILAELKAE